VTAIPAVEARWQLYRLLGEPVRLRLLALAEHEELALGELAELLGEALPNVSRHAAPLRQAGLLAERRHGTRTFVRLADEALADPVIRDALVAGRALCSADGSLDRIREIVERRDARTREFFDRPSAGDEPMSLAAELPAYLLALSVLVPDRGFAVDAGTGDGVLLDALAPIFGRVVGIDRSEAQLARAARRVAERGYSNVTLLCAELGDEVIAETVGAGADVVVAARMLHHAPRPLAAMEALVRLLRPGGKLVVIDYERHADEAFRERQADVWNGFEPSELEAHAEAAGLVDVRARTLPSGLVQSARDGHIGWQVLVGTRPPRETRRDASSSRKESFRAREA
jgi:ArsR family transcriptional regulator